MIKKAIILLAGFEKNLSPYTDEMHQCLFNLGKSTILEDLLTKLSKCDVKDVMLVVGHKSELIKEKVGKNFKNLNIYYVENKQYLSSKTGMSLSLTKNFVTDDTLLIDGDMIFEEELIKDLINSSNSNMIAVDFSENETSKTIINSKILNSKVVEIGPNVEKTNTSNFARFLGIGKFTKDFMAEVFKYFDKNNLKLNELIYEDAINCLIKNNAVYAFNTRKYNWFEVDNIEVFKKAKKIYGDTTDLKEKAVTFGADDVFIVLPSEIIFDDRARLQCLNCKNYGVKRTCPPFKESINYPKLIKKYKKGLLVVVNADCSQDFQKARTQSTNKLHQILLKLEKEAFSQDNHFTTSFIGGSCKLCPQGCAIEHCRNPHLSRSPLEATGVDVVETLKKFGLFLKFPAKDSIYRVGLLLIG